MPVIFDKSSGKWRAYVYIGKQQIHFGFYPTKEEAELGLAVGMGSDPRVPDDYKGPTPTAEQIAATEKARAKRVLSDHVGVAWDGDAKAYRVTYYRSITDFVSVGYLRCDAENPETIAKAKLYRACAIHLDRKVTPKQRNAIYHHAVPTSEQIAEYREWKRSLQIRKEGRRGLGGVMKRDNTWGIYVHISTPRGRRRMLLGTYGSSESREDFKEALHLRDCATLVEPRIPEMEKRYNFGHKPTKEEIAIFKQWFKPRKPITAELESQLDMAKRSRSLPPTTTAVFTSSSSASASSSSSAAPAADSFDELFRDLWESAVDGDLETESDEMLSGEAEESAPFSSDPEDLADDIFSKALQTYDPVLFAYPRFASAASSSYAAAATEPETAAAPETAAKAPAYRPAD